MRFLRKHLFWLFLFGLVAGLVSAPSPQTARTRLADGFDQPVGKPDAEGYYRSRGFRPNYHMGDDWNGAEGGNSDLGKPVYSTANGLVVLARDMRMGWGNLVIIRHTYLEDKKMKTVDSVYAHLDKIMVRENQQVVRGQQVGTIGTNRGMYTAHLHFEIRKNIHIGYNQRGFAKDYTNYYSPVAFIEPRRKLPGAGRSAMVAINTFDLAGRGGPATDESELRTAQNGRPGSRASSPAPSPKKSSNFRVNRFDDSF
jgi:murein DD-endopeptidase MepM/ murein hydrolase activator NlpD